MTGLFDTCTLHTFMKSVGLEDDQFEFARREGYRCILAVAIIGKQLRGL